MATAWSLEIDQTNPDEKHWAILESEKVATAADQDIDRILRGHAKRRLSASSRQLSNWIEISAMFDKADKLENY